MNVNMKLTQKLKIQITQLLVAIAYFNVEGGESQKQKGRTKNCPLTPRESCFVPIMDIVKVELFPLLIVSVL